MTNLSVPLYLYGWANYAADGTLLAGGENLVMLKGGAGLYLVTPNDNIFGKSLAMVSSTLGESRIVSVDFTSGLGSSGTSIEVATFSDTGAATNAPFVIMVYSMGKDYSVVP